jgi:hypothetical protein
MGAEKGDDISRQDFAEHRIILDLPSKAPALGFQGYAKAFKEIIEKSEPQFAIGILGGWGTGKTTLMQCIKDSLDKRQVIPVEFSAWRYEREQHLIIPLLDAVRDSLLQWSRANAEKDVKRTAAQTASTVGRVMRALLAGITFKAGVPGTMEVSLDANRAISELDRLSQLRRDKLYAELPQSFYYAGFRALSEAFEGFIGTSQRRIVVFIDDLDRCLPEGALEVIESMKLFFDLKGFVFVVGLDQSVVETLIDLKYETHPSLAQQGKQWVRGSEYIKKIFQVPFTLPPVSLDLLDDFLEALDSDAKLPEVQSEHIHKIVRPHLEALVRRAGNRQEGADETWRSSAGGVNPREIKRYINAYTLAIKVKPHLDSNALLALQTILFRSDWDKIKNALYSYRRLFTNAVRQELDGQAATALEDLDPDLSTISRNTTFWNYIAGLGRPLLEVPNIDEYIYAAGTAIDFTPDPRLQDSIHAVGRILRGLRGISDYVENQENAEFVTSNEWKDIVLQALHPEDLSRIEDSVYAQQSSSGNQSRLHAAYLEDLNSSSTFLLNDYDGSKAAFQDRYAKLKESLDVLRNYFIYLNDRPYASLISPGVSKGSLGEAAESPIKSRPLRREES